MDRKEKGTMFAITGITGNVGGNVARNLLAAGRPVRAVMRDVRKGDGWAQRGCELATADILDVAALASATSRMRKASSCWFRRTSIRHPAFPRRGPRPPL